VNEVPSSKLVWFGVLGGGLAWATQFVANLFLTFAECNPLSSHRSIPLHPIEIAISIAAVLITLSAEGVALVLFRQTARVDDTAQEEMRGLGSLPPVGRVNFLSMMGLLVNFLSLAIIVMTAFGAPFSFLCQQS
jgi:hypothetical protein